MRALEIPREVVPSVIVLRESRETAFVHLRSSAVVAFNNARGPCPVPIELGGGELLLRPFGDAGAARVTKMVNLLAPRNRRTWSKCVE